MCTTLVQVDNLAHLGSKSELIEKLQMQKENTFFVINHSLKQHALNFEGPCWWFFMLTTNSILNCLTIQLLY